MAARVPCWALSTQSRLAPAWPSGTSCGSWWWGGGSALARRYGPLGTHTWLARTVGAHGAGGMTSGAGIRRALHALVPVPCRACSWQRGGQGLSMRCFWGLWGSTGGPQPPSGSGLSGGARADASRRAISPQASDCGHSRCRGEGGTWGWRCAGATGPGRRVLFQQGPMYPVSWELEFWSRGPRELGAVDPVSWVTGCWSAGVPWTQCLAARVLVPRAWGTESWDAAPTGVPAAPGAFSRPPCNRRALEPAGNAGGLPPGGPSLPALPPSRHQVLQHDVPHRRQLGAAG